LASTERLNRGSAQTRFPPENYHVGMAESTITQTGAQGYRTSIAFFPLRIASRLSVFDPSRSLFTRVEEDLLDLLLQRQAGCL
jgi:hypothetical protein